MGDETRFRRDHGIREGYDGPKNGTRPFHDFYELRLPPQQPPQHISKPWGDKYESAELDENRSPESGVMISIAELTGTNKKGVWGLHEVRSPNPRYPLAPRNGAM